MSENGHTVGETLTCGPTLQSHRLKRFKNKHKKSFLMRLSCPWGESGHTWVCNPHIVSRKQSWHWNWLRKCLFVCFLGWRTSGTSLKRLVRRRATYSESTIAKSHDKTMPERERGRERERERERWMTSRKETGRKKETETMRKQAFRNSKKTWKIKKIKKQKKRYTVALRAHKRPHVLWRTDEVKKKHQLQTPPTSLSLSYLLTAHRPSLTTLGTN